MAKQQRERAIVVTPEEQESIERILMGMYDSNAYSSFIETSINKAMKHYGIFVVLPQEVYNKIADRTAKFGEDLAEVFRYAIGEEFNAYGMTSEVMVRFPHIMNSYIEVIVNVLGEYYESEGDGHFDDECQEAVMWRVSQEPHVQFDAECIARWTRNKTEDEFGEVRAVEE